MDMEKIKAKVKELKERQSGGDQPFITLEEGDNLVRVVPGKGDADFYQEVGYHYIKRGKDKKTYLCNELTFGTPCFFCEFTKQLKKSKDKDDKALGKDWSRRYRCFMKVIDRAVGTTKEAWKFLGVGSSIFGQMLGYIADDDWGDMTEVATGYDVVINKTKTGTGDMDVEYDVRPRPKRTPLGFTLEDDPLPGFETFLEIAMTAEEQEADFLGSPAPEKPEATPPPAKTPTPPPLAKTPVKKAATPPPPPPPAKTEEQLEIERLEALLDMTDAGVVALHAKWKKGNGTAAGLKQVMELLGIESSSEPEAPAEEAKEAPPAAQTDLDNEVEAALARYKAAAAAKKAGK